MQTVSRSSARNAFALTILASLALGTSGCVALSRSSVSLASFASAAMSLHSSSAMLFAARADYQEDVRALAQAAARSGATGEELRAHVGRIAAHHGLTDWEADEPTYHALGEGLALAGVEVQGARAFAEEIASGDVRAERAVIEGYES